MSLLENAAVDSEDGCLLSLKVIPRSSRNQIVGVEQGVFKLKLQAPPVEGAANEAVLEFLSERLGCAKSSLTLASGHQSRHKRVKVKGMKAVEALELLNRNIKGKPNG